jgi:hypothetical protein
MFRHLVLVSVRSTLSQGRAVAVTETVKKSAGGKQ